MKYPWVMMAMSVLLLGCSSPTVTPPTSNSEEVSNSDFAGQMLPIEATTVIGDEVIELEVARTPEQQAMGLMFRESLGDGRGMLFPFPEPRPTRFWMKNTLIPLDMIFIREGKVIAIAPDVPPCEKDPCPSYGPESDVFVDQVLELRAGRAEDLELEVGDPIEIQYLTE